MITNEAPATPGLPGSYIQDAEGNFHPVDENGVPTDGYVVPSDAPAAPAKRSFFTPSE